MENFHQEPDSKLLKQAKQWFWDGEKYREEGELEKAADLFIKACQLFPDYDFVQYAQFFDSWHRVGLVLMQCDRTEEAKLYLNRALEHYTAKQKKHYPYCQGNGSFAKAQIYALLGEKAKMLQMLAKSFKKEDQYVSDVYGSPEFLDYHTDPEFTALMQKAIAAIKQKRNAFSVTELAVMGCENCRGKGLPTDGHDWTMICRQCGNTFSYGGCSCDGCCGGTYAGFGGGETTYYV